VGVAGCEILRIGGVQRGEALLLVIEAGAVCTRYTTRATLRYIPFLFCVLFNVCIQGAAPITDVCFLMLSHRK
jgi:hypothetical protein